MQRCLLRREWMERLGYAPSQGVLPTSHLAGAFFPENGASGSAALEHLFRHSAA